MLFFGKLCTIYEKRQKGSSMQLTSNGGSMQHFASKWQVVKSETNLVLGIETAP